jgi:LysM repeat protein
VRQPAVPTNASIQSIHNDAGQVKVLLEDNTVMATNDGINWVASALPQPAPPTVTPKKDKVKIIYIVKNGDFLYRIARKYKTSISNILKWNKNIKNINSIHKGDKIVVGFK